MTRRTVAAALLAALHHMAMGALGATPAMAMQILEAIDHAELAAEVSAREVKPHRALGRPDREGGPGAGRVRGRARHRHRATSIFGRPLRGPPPATRWRCSSAPSGASPTA